MFAVIMAGGAGTRFWPASKETLPKQFLKITGDRTMLEQTIARIERFSSNDRTYVVIGRKHQPVTEQLLHGTSVKIIIEPTGRNTTPCIGLAALHMARIDENEPMVVLPADHYIADLDNFSETIKAGAEIARGGAIITLGIAPTRPETGYGYIKTSSQIGQIGQIGTSLNRPYFKVDKFVEKPNFETAVSYLNDGNYLWNSGIFIFTAKTILTEIKTCLPELYKGLEEINRSIGTDKYDETLERVYGTLPSISIDYGVMEKTAKPVNVFKADFAWSDVGSWQALYELRSSEYNSSKNLILKDIGKTMIEDSEKNLIYSTSEREIALLGVDNLIIVDTPDTLMVADVTRSQDVKIFTQKKN